jgi:DNA-binding CsgD family transcriptional regulator
MASRSATQAVTGSIIAVCNQGHPPERLKAEVLSRLRRVVPVDALWWATCDPATLLFTQAFRDGIPDRMIPYFVDNEFGGEDVNRWTDLAQDPDGVGTLARSTGGDLSASARYRELFEPLGLGDELRAVLRTGDDCWGLMCLHREAGGSFSEAEVQLVKRLAPHLGAGLRTGLLIAGAGEAPAADAPGLVVLDGSGELVAATSAAREWFAELRVDTGGGSSVPLEVTAAAALLRRDHGADPATRDARVVPRLRVRTRAGRWVVLHSSWLDDAEAGAAQIAVIVEPAAPREVAAVIMAAYGLTERERAVTGLVCRGRSTAQIAAELRISANTVQDHLKAVFDKTGVRSRREVMSRVLRDHYLPGLKQSWPVGPNGYYRATPKTTGRESTR